MEQSKSVESIKVPVESDNSTFFAVIILLAAALVISGLVSGKWTRTNETTHVFDTLVQGRGCVVADVKSRTPSSYRCDKPIAGQYVDAKALWAEASAIVDVRYAKK